MRKSKAEMMYRGRETRLRPKKVKVERMAEEMPERWELRESREGCAEEEVDVGAYIRFKKEEEAEEQQSSPLYLRAIE